MSDTKPEFKLGDTVTFKLGDTVTFKLNPGPKMVILSLTSDGHALCHWWLSNGDWRERTFLKAALTLVEKPA